jgi:hypothetical protein
MTLEQITQLLLGSADAGGDPGERPNAKDQVKQDIPHGLARAGVFAALPKISSSQQSKSRATSPKLFAQTLPSRRPGRFSSMSPSLMPWPLVTNNRTQLIYSTGLRWTSTRSTTT